MTTLLRLARRVLPRRVRLPLRDWRDRAYVSRLWLLRRIAIWCGAHGTQSYAERLANETETFAAQTEVHALPAIFDYWSNTHIVPQLQAFGYEGVEDFLAKELIVAARSADAAPTMLSIGAGNCDLEVALARQLRAAGIGDFVIECLDINATMLERGRRLADEADVGSHIRCVNTDLNAWVPARHYAAVIANQSLHHVTNLEHLFESVAVAIGDSGVLLTSDIIGRNGHMRWPEALAIVQEFWQELPKRKRYNVQLQRHERRFMNWDCSREGFEGIRAQDILPLLLQSFRFEWFFGYANVILPFVDRSFGPHFDAHAAADRALIDRIHARDEAAMRAGTITPTLMLAKLSRRPLAVCTYRDGLAPERCVRVP